MEFCGRCGNELGRGLEQGRFCAACGHESPGNARYPLYAEGSGAGAPGGTAVVERPTEPATDTATQVAELTELRRIVQPPAPAAPALEASPVPTESPAAVRTAPAPTYASDEEPTAWRTALIAGLVAMLAVVLLGLFLMLR